MVAGGARRVEKGHMRVPAVLGTRRTLMAMVDSGTGTGGDTALPSCTGAERLQVLAAVRPQAHVRGPPCPSHLVPG